MKTVQKTHTQKNHTENAWTIKLYEKINCTKIVKKKKKKIHKANKIIWKPYGEKGKFWSQTTQCWF